MNDNILGIPPGADDTDDILDLVEHTLEILKALDGPAFVKFLQNRQLNDDYVFITGILIVIK